MKRFWKPIAMLLALILVLAGCAPQATIGTETSTPRQETSSKQVESSNQSNASSSQPGIKLPELSIVEASTSVERSTENSESSPRPEKSTETPAGQENGNVVKGQPYYSKDDVAQYLHLYKKLPPNYIKKNDAMDLGWDASKGNLWDVTDQMVIGGDRFGNREGLLPTKKGRQYFEADVDYEGGYRDAKRIVYSNDGLIYYTDDHYESFTKLY